MKLLQKNIDERQEKELLKLERIAFWIAFWGLAVSSLTQFLVFNADLKQIAGEVIIFFVMTVCIVCGNVKNGQFGYYDNKMSMKECLVYSSLTTVAYIILLTIKLGFPKNIFLYRVIPALCVLVISFIVFSLYGLIIKKRRNKLANEYQDK